MLTDENRSEDPKLSLLTQFLLKHNISKSKKKLRDMLLLSELHLEAYKSNVVISSCCKVCNFALKSWFYSSILDCVNIVCDIYLYRI